ncbi:MAG: DNRLRE domain-containing protein [Gemmataceae bacterium]|nr:DNRLRE domain-containing protein [Gemmataceae bacterium]MDW8266862.1 DNRLRE domain-containing protein [Gemmataceae bacterium]
MFRRWLQRFVQFRGHSAMSCRFRVRRPKHQAARPALELLEDRLAPAVATFQEGVAGYLGTQDITLDLKSPGQVKNDDKINADKGGTVEEKQGLLRFDQIFGNLPGQIPPGSTINSVSLRLTLNQGQANSTISFYRLTVNWSEASTFSHFAAGGHGIQPGVETLSTPDLVRSFTTAPTGSITLSGPGLVATVQAWADGTVPNYGWAFLTSGPKFEVFSSERTNTAQRPLLTIDYTPPSALPPAAADDTATSLNGAQVTVDVLANDFVPPGSTLTNLAIVQGPAAGSATVNASNQIVYTPPGFTYEGVNTIVYQFTTSTNETAQATLTVTSVYDPFGLGTVASFQQGNSYSGTQDAQIDRKNPTQVKGSEDKVSADKGGTAEEKQALLRFDNIFGYGPGQIPPGSTINAVRLVLGVKESSNTAVTLHRMVTDWNQTTASANAFPAGGPMVQFNDLDARSVPDISFTVSSASNYSRTLSNAGLLQTVRAWAEGTASNYGWVISTSGGKFEIFSSENGTAAERPRLLIDHTPPPHVPAGATNDTANSHNGAEVVADVLSNDFIPPGDTITNLMIVQGPAAGSAQVTTNNRIVFTPPGVSYVGVNTIVYQFTTSRNETAQGTLTITSTYDPFGLGTVVDFTKGNTHGYSGPREAILEVKKPNEVKRVESTLNADKAGSNEEKQALIRFDGIVGYGPGQIPPQSRINAVRLVLVAKEAGGGQVRLNRMLVNWDPATATPGSFADGGLGVQMNDVEAMATPDFGQTVAAGKNVPRIFSGPGLVQTVQAWVNGSPNYGWVVTSPSKFEFWSTSNLDPLLRPALLVDYTPPADLPPVANDDAALSINGQTIAIRVLANDHVPGGQASHLAVVSQPQHGIAWLDDGYFVYSPDPGYNGYDQFSYRFTSANGTSNVAQVTVTVATQATFLQGSYGYHGVHDTYVWSVQPDAVQGLETSVSLQERTRQGAIRFQDIFGNGDHQIRPGAPILSARLTLTIFDDDSKDSKPGSDSSGAGNPNANLAQKLSSDAPVKLADNEIGLFRILQAWDQHSLSWNAVVHGLHLDDIEVSRTLAGRLLQAPGARSVDVTDDVVAWAQGVPNYGWALFTKKSDDAWAFHSSEADPLLRPRLTIVYFDNAPPVASAGGPYLLSPGDSVTLDASASFDPEGGPLTYSWDINGDRVFGDATGVNPSLSWGQLVGLGISHSASFPVTVAVTDNLGQTSYASTVLQVGEEPPPPPPEGVELYVDSSILENNFATLTLAFIDFHPDAPLTVIIDWGDGSPPETFVYEAGTTAVSEVHQYLDDVPSDTPADTFTVTVRVLGGAAEHVKTVTLTVHNVPPTIEDIALTDATYQNGVVSLTGTLSDPGIADSFTLMVDWGDGTGTHSYPLGSATSFDRAYLYARPGVYSVQVTVRDDDQGRSTTSAFFVRIDNAPPSFTHVQLTPTVVEGSMATLSGGFHDPGNLDTFKLVVDWGDGSGSEEFHYPAGTSAFSHGRVYPRPGQYVVTLTLYDNHNAPATAVRTIQVVPMPTTIHTVQVTASSQPYGPAMLHGNVSTSPHTGSLTVTINWGDGSAPETFTYSGNTTTFDQAHRYRRNGTYQVTVTVNDGTTSAHAVRTVTVTNVDILAVGTGTGAPHVKVFDAHSGELRHSFYAYHPSFLGGVRVATGDVNGDGIPDIITAAGPGGGPHVQVFSGNDLSLLYSFFAYSPAFTGGVLVAAGDINGDGFADIITGADAGGGPHVRAFSGKDLSVLVNMMAYDPTFLGGVRVATGDVNGDGFADVITTPGPGGGPHVRAFSGKDGSVLLNFFAFDATMTAGLHLATGDVTGDGRADLIIGSGAGATSTVRVFRGSDGALLSQFTPYGPGFTGGTYVAAVDANGDGRADIVTGAGPGGGPHVRVFDALSLAEIDGFFAFDPGFFGGVPVAGHRP